MPRYKKAQPYAASVIQAAVRRAVTKQVNKNIETKQSCYSSSDGTEIAHNNFITLSNRLLSTTQGITDPQTTDSLNRIGDSINLKGVSIKVMVEANERYSDVTFRLLVVKTARNVTPTRATLFNGLSGNKMIDTLNTEKFTVLAQKYFKIKAGNTGISSASYSGGYDNIGSTNAATYSRPTRVVKLWIPGTKFARSGIITYEDGTSNVKFFDYHVLLYAYSNYTTLQDVFNVGRLNDFVSVMYYKDA